MIKKAIIIALVLLGVYLIYAAYSKLSNTGYIERITKIDLPFWTSTIETFDNGEFAVIGKYQIGMDEIDEFCAKNNITDDCSGKSCAMGFMHLLEENNRMKEKDLSNCLFFSDCSDSNTWRVLVNQKNGEIWIEVSYPDMSGDASPCDS